MTKGWRWQVVLLLLWGVLGCAPPQGQEPLLESPAVEAPTATATVRATPSPRAQPTATRRPWPTRRPTATYTPTPLFALRYEATPVASPQPEEVAERARALACEPPCWFGLEPGISTLEDLRNLWGKWSEIFWEWDEKTQTYQGYLTNPAFYIGFEADRQGVLTFLEVQPKFRLLPEYYLPTYLRRLGPPPWMVIEAVWGYPGEGEMGAQTDFFTLGMFVGYPSKYIVFDLPIGDSQPFGFELPQRIQACVSSPQYYAFFYAFPKSTFHDAWVWNLQDYAEPEARFLTTKEEIWEQIVEERDPFCVEMELLDE